jgi:gluconolactonase
MKATLITLLALTSIVSAQEVEKLAGNMKFTEGAVWIPAKNALVWSDIPNSVLMQWSKDDGAKEYRKVNSTNGNILDADGRIVSCEHGSRSVIREEKDGTITTLIDSFEGKKLNSPNDLIIHSDGSIWFTDPSYGLNKTNGAKELDGQYVYRLDPKTKKITVITKDFDMPNGIVFSPDEKTIIISDTGSIGKVRAFPVNDDNTIGKMKWEADLRSDGMCVDKDGNIYTTTGKGIQVLSPDGKLIKTIAIPEHPANCTLGGEDNKTLFVTARTGLYAVRF